MQKNISYTKEYEKALIPGEYGFLMNVGSRQMSLPVE